MIYILILAVIILMLLSYKLSNEDYMSPPFLMTVMFLISILCAWYMRNDWLFKIQPLTCFIIVFGIISFYLGYYVIYYCFINNRKMNKITKLKYIEIKIWKILIYYFVAVLFCYLYIKSIINGVGFNGTWSQTMEKFRYATAYTGATGLSINIPSYVLTGRFAVNSAGYVFVYTCVNNFLVKKKWDKYQLIAILISIISSMLGASRLDLIRIPISFLVIYYILKCRTGKITQKDQIKLIIRYIGIALAVIICFSELRTFVGRQNTSGIIEYISQYLGAPIVLLDDYFKKPIISSNLFGKESFWGIYNFLHSITGNSLYAYDYTLEFRTINGINLGNVYTAFRMYYSDFKMVGVVIMNFIAGIVFATLYVMIRLNIKIRLSNFNIFRSKSMLDFNIIIYSVIIHSVIMMFYADWFFSQVLSWTQFKAIIFMWLIKVLLVDCSKKNKETIGELIKY